MAMNSESGSLKGGDQPRMTERQLNKEQMGTGRMSYVRQAQRGGLPQRNYGRSSSKR